MLVDLITLKAYLNLDGSEFDGILTKLENWVEEYITVLCHQPIIKTTVEEWLKAYSGKLILLYHPVKVIEIKDGEGVVVETSDYKIKTIGGITYIESDFFREGTYWVVKFDVGYNTVPKPVEEVATEMVAVRFFESEQAGGQKGGRLGKARITEAMSGMQQTATDFHDLLPKWKKMLAPYTRPIV